MRWYKELIIGVPYYLVGFADRGLTVPFVSTYVYIGIGALDSATKDRYCFQDPSSYFAELGDKLDSAESEEPDYVVLTEDSLDMVADKEGLIDWLRSPYATPAAASLGHA